jgi:nicotinamide-nucleotide amidase
MQPVSEMQTPELVALLADLMREKKWMLTTAESCTGGLIAGACTEVSGSS